MTQINLPELSNGRYQIVLDVPWHHKHPEVRNPDRHWYEHIHCRGGALISLYDEYPAPIFRLYTPMVKSARAVFNHIRNIPGVWADFNSDAEAVIYFPPEILDQVAELAGAQKTAGPEADARGKVEPGRGRQGPSI